MINDKIEILNRLKFLFWEYHISHNQFLLKLENSEDTKKSFSAEKISLQEYLAFFSPYCREILDNIFEEYKSNKRKSHKLLCELKLFQAKLVSVINLGYLSDDGSIIKGVIVQIQDESDEVDQVEEIKRILSHISSYTDEEFWIRDLNFKYLFISKNYSKIYDYSAEELLNTPIEKIFPPESIYYLKHNIEEELKFSHSNKYQIEKSPVFILRGYKKNGQLVWTENSINFIKDTNDEIIAFWGITRDVTDRIKSEQIKEALYKISEYSHLTEELNEFFLEVQSIVSAIMPVKNFAIYLYDKDKKSLSLDYHSDINYSKSYSDILLNLLFNYVSKYEKPTFLDLNTIKKICEEENIELNNNLPLQWIGIPLKAKNEIIGLLTVSNYEQSTLLTEGDFENLKFVADQTSMVIERKINYKEKQKIKSLLEAVSKAQSILLTKRDVFLAIQLALEEIGKIIEVNRISLYENLTDIPNNTVYANLISEWISNSNYADGKIEKLDYNQIFSRWLNEFNLGKIIEEKLNSLPLNEYEILKVSKAKSFLCIPIFLTKKLWGFIKFDDCNNERVWTDQEISVLSVVAASIGGIFQRKIAEETLKTSEEKYRNFINNSMEGISLLQFTEPIDTTLPIEDQIDKIYEYGFIAEANHSLAAMYGLSSTQDIVGKTLIEIHGGSDNEVNREAFRAFINNGYKVINVETVEKKIDGTDIIILNNSIGILQDKKLKSIWGSQIDITERKKFELELQQAKEKAEEASRIKSNFLSNMSHELRTPLIGVLGYAEILMDELKGTDYEEMAGIIFQSGNRLLETLNSILTISKIESEKFSLNYSEFDLKEVIEEVVEIFKPTAVKKNLNLTTEYSDEKMLIFSDNKLIREILNNLVNNAVKFTPKGSVNIKAIINFEKNKLFLSVSDTGVGIPEDKLGLIFEEFRQASEGLSRSFEGVGLGLSICKKYVDFLNGKITVTSKVNEGSTFTVEIPLSLNK
ncbi:MAG: ATP-binding protein [Ignavibacterium sp.]|nr:ATP-binding protein [Ignavibacterium sp.]